MLLNTCLSVNTCFRSTIMTDIELSDALLLAGKRKIKDNSRRRDKRLCPDMSSMISSLVDQVAELSPLSPADDSFTSLDELDCSEQRDDCESEFLDDFLHDDLLSMDDIEYADLQPSPKPRNDASSHPLHYHTDLKTIDFCRSLLLFIRKSNLNKTHVNNLLNIISSALPEPNFLPTTLSKLVDMISSKLLLLPNVEYDCRRVRRTQGLS
jgi:hypothetical protein